MARQVRGREPAGVTTLLPGTLAGGLVALPCGCIEACSNTGIRRPEESMGLREMFARKEWLGFRPYPRAR
jgi:hypothetical protein